MSGSGAKCKALDCLRKWHQGIFDKDNTKHLSLYRFPSTKDRCDLWVERTGNVELLQIKTKNLHLSSRLCSLHFERSQFTNDLMNRLNRNAVPTLFGDKVYTLTERVTLRQPLIDLEPEDDISIPRNHDYCPPARRPVSAPPRDDQTGNEARTFVAHRDLLSLASPKLSAMLDGDGHMTGESKCYRVLELDVDEEVCRELMRYIYLGKIGHVNNKLTLLEAAKQYEVLSLFERLQTYIPVNVSNAADMLILADRLDAVFLRDKAVACINSQPMGVMATAGWQTLLDTKPILLATLFTAQVAHQVAAQPDNTS